MPGNEGQNPSGIKLHFPTRHRQARGDHDTVTERFTRACLTPERTAIVACDLWNAHWCRSANSRMQELAPRVDHFLSSARNQGMLILHSPSGTLEQYNDHPARQKVLALANPSPMPARDTWYERNPEREPPLPIDASDGGCPCTPACTPRKVFTRQSEAVVIDSTDMISTNELEIQAIFDRLAIERVLILGVHLNMCMLGRSFGIRRWVELGRDILLVRDLTDVIYNPKSYPHVTLDRALSLTIAHVEACLCPSVSSTDILRAMSVTSLSCPVD